MNVGPPPIRPEEAEERPARHLLVPGERRADPEALRRVVKREADDEDDGEADLVARGGLADREAFGEVVQPDARGDEHGEPFRGREAGEVVLLLVLELAGEAAPGPSRNALRRRAFIHAS